MQLVTLVVPAFGVMLMLLCAVELAKPEPSSRPGQRLAMLSLALLFVVAPLMESVQLSGSSVAQAISVATVVATAPMAALALSMSRRTVRLPPFLWAPSVLVLIFLVINTVNNPYSGQRGALMRLVLVMFWASMALLIAIARVDVRGASLLLMLQFGTACSFTLLTATPTRDCDVFKCGQLGSLFTGPFESENLMGQFAALAMVSLLVRTTNPIRWLGGATAGMVLYATVSRTSGIAVIVALLTAALIRRLPRDAVRTRARAGFLLVLSATAVGLYVLFTAAPGDWSNRGRFWRLALNHMEGRWAIGRGVDEWVRLQDTGVLPNLYPHSQYLLMAFWAGIIGLVLWLAFLRWMLVLTADDEVAGPFAASLALLVSTLGVAETFWNPLALDSRTMTLSVFLMLALAATRPNDKAPQGHDGVASVPVHEGQPTNGRPPGRLLARQG